MQKELIFIGLGRMGAAMTAKLTEAGYTVHGYDVNEAARAEAATNGVHIYDSVADSVAAMPGKKIVWIMVPATHVEDVLVEVQQYLQPKDIIIDGGNTFYRDTQRRAVTAEDKGFYYVDCGTSGGVDGAREGASLMVGGPDEVVGEIAHIFTTLAVAGGYGHVGNTGAGHFVKMVHNGIEYGMMGAIAEGMSFLEDQPKDLSINMLEVLKSYEHGSIISSNLMHWMSQAYRQPGYLKKIVGEVPMGETEMEIEHIVAKDKTPVLKAALQQRKDSRTNRSRTGTLIAAMRNLFGGHKTINK